MRALFVGDIHGRVFHLMALILELEQREGIRADTIVQVGDLGVYPDPEGAGLLENKFVKSDPTELDFSRMLRAGSKLADSLQRFREHLSCPIYFIRGNHEDHAWLLAKAAESDGRPVQVDPFGIFEFVPDGHVIEAGGTRIAFLGGTDAEPDGAVAFDEQAYEQLASSQAERIDVLVTHDAPYGVGTGYHGDIQGSQRITSLIEALKPTWLITGHYHHLIGPRDLDGVSHVGLAQLVPPIRKDPEQTIPKGSMTILDTEAGTLAPIEFDWLGEFTNQIDYCKLLTDEFVGR